MTETKFILSAVDQTQAAFNSIRSRLSGIETAVGALGVALSATAFVGFIKGSIDAADKLNDLSQKTGTAVKDLAGLSFAAEQNGASLDLVANAAKKLSTQLVENPEQFKKLGITAKDSTGAMVQLADVFAVMPDGVQKTALAVKLMGRSGEEIIPFMNQGTDALRGLIEEGQRLNPITAEMARNADSFNDSLARLKLTSGTVGINIANNLLPAFSQITEAMVDASKEGSILKTVWIGLGGVGTAIFTDNLLTREQKLTKDIKAAQLALQSLEGNGPKNQMGNEKRAEISRLQNELSAITSSAAAAAATEAAAKRTREEVAAAKSALEEKARLDKEAADKRLRAAKPASDALAALQLEQLKKEAEQSGLTAAQIKVLELARKGASAAQITAAQAAATSIDAITAEIEAKKAQQKTEAEMLTTLESGTAAIRKEIEATQYETSIIGLTTDQITLMQAARDDHIITVMEERLAILDAAGACTAESEALREQIKVRKELKAVTEGKAAAEAAQAIKKVTQEQTKTALEEWKKYTDGINNSLTDALFRGFEHGKSFSQNFADTLKNMFRTMILRPTISATLAPVTGAIAGVMSGSAGATDMGGSSGGVGSWLSAGQSLWSAFSGGMVGGMGSLAVSAGQLFGSTALAEFGAGMSFAGAGGTVAGAAGGSAALSAGTAVGAAMPYVAAALAVASLWGSAFGKSKGPSGPTTVAGNFDQSGFSGTAQTPWYQKGGWFSASGSGTYVDPLPAATTAAFTQAAQLVKAQLDGVAKSANTALPSLAGWSYSFNQQVTNQEQVTAVTNAMADSMAVYLIPALKDFQQQGESTSAALARMNDVFNITNSIADLVGASFGAVGFSSALLRNNLVELMGGLQNASAAMQGYYSNFYSVTEQSANSLKSITAVLRTVGIDAVPDSKEAFRALVEAQNLSTAAGRQTFAALIGVQAAFVQVTDAAKTLADEAIATAQAQAKAQADAAAQVAAAQAEALKLFVDNVNGILGELNSGILSISATVNAMLQAATTEATTWRNAQKSIQSYLFGQQSAGAQFSQAIRSSDPAVLSGLGTIADSYKASLLASSSTGSEYALASAQINSELAKKAEQIGAVADSYDMQVKQLDTMSKLYDLFDQVVNGGKTLGVSAQDIVDGIQILSGSVSTTSSATEKAIATLDTNAGTGLSRVSSGLGFVNTTITNGLGESSAISNSLGGVAGKVSAGLGTDGYINKSLGNVSTGVGTVKNSIINGLGSSGILSSAIGDVAGNVDAGLGATTGNNKLDALIASMGTSGSYTLVGRMTDMIDAIKATTEERTKYVSNLQTNASELIAKANSAVDTYTANKSAYDTNAGNLEAYRSKIASEASNTTGTYLTGKTGSLEEIKAAADAILTPQNVALVETWRNSSVAWLANITKQYDNLKIYSDGITGTLAEYNPIMQSQSSAMGTAKNDYSSLTGDIQKAIEAYRLAGGIDALPELKTFAVGTNYLPSDMIAQVHAGERIIPAADNRELMARLQNPNEANNSLVTEIKALRASHEKMLDELTKLREQNNAGHSKTANQSKSTTDLLDNISGGGGPLLVQVTA